MARARKPKRGRCAYCGEERELTRDHVPPENLFASPRPSDLITVPSCFFCNNGSSKDDQYFSFMVKLGINRKRFPGENEDSISSIYKTTKPSRAGWQRYLLQRYRPGIGAFTVDRKRVGRSLRRIVRGLFYHSVETRLPEFVPFDFVSLSDEPRKAAALRDVMAELRSGLRTIGGGRFGFAFAQLAPTDPFVTAWLLTFYDHRAFFCFTSNPRSKLA